MVNILWPARPFVDIVSGPGINGGVAVCPNPACVKMVSRLEQPYSSGFLLHNLLGAQVSVRRESAQPSPLGLRFFGG